MNLRLKTALCAARWLGVKEGSREHGEILEVYNGIRPLPRGYAMEKSDPWCAAFASAVAVMAGAGERYPLECGCSKIIEGAKMRGIWVEDDAHVPQIGDWLLYNWEAKASEDDTGAPDHVGVVIGMEKGEILVVEGNYDNAVKLRRVPLDWQKIRGFVCPEGEVENMVFHTLEELPEYARATIEKLTENGSLMGVARDDLGLSADLVRTLVILDRLGKL